jgi:hypothetical protein
VDRHREHAKGCLEGSGFRVEEIAEADEERADLRVSDEAALYIVEVKGKEVSAEYRELVASVRGGAVASLSRTIEYRNRLDGIIRKAESQLVSTPAPLGAFGVLWVSCLEGDVGFILAEFERTLYGVCDVAAYQANDLMKRPSIIPCFYYHHSSFFRYQRIDAVVLSGPDGGHLCVNEFAHRPDDFRRSRLYILLSQANAVMDPPLMERAGQAIAVRGDIDRTDPQAKWDYLRNTYGYMTAPAKDFHGVVMTSVPLRRQQ